MEKWICLDGLRLDVSIGIHDFELLAPQPYKLDISLQLTSAYKTLFDEITETVNYDELRNNVMFHLASKHFNLQETLVQDVVGICFALDSRIIKVDIKTVKTAVYPDCDSVGLHYIVSRGEWM